MVSFEYDVTDPETGETKFIVMPAEAIKERYDKMTTPTKMFVKDYACAKGLFPWSAYARLTVKRSLY